MTEQRRLAAIVSADVAGYSRLMGRDESGTLAALKALRQELIDPAIANHGGRIVKTTGDGLLLEFPSVVNAVRCAVEVQAAMADRATAIAEDQRIAFRIGINIGDIIVEGDDIFGDGVNVAARLQEVAAPGGICISSRVHEDVRDRLDTAFDDGGTQTLKNIARPVQVWRWQPGTAESPKPAPAPTALPLPDKPSIAVLPFQNMSGDPEQEYFVDGLVEDVITALSRFNSLFVIARNSSFAYKGKSPDIRQVSRDLGVRYVLEGSVRRASNRLRITGQLIDSLTGNHIWAERYDRVLADVFELQEEVTRAIVGAIAPQIERAEIARSFRVRPGNLGAYEHALRALGDVRDSYIKSDKVLRDRAVAFARKAILLDERCGLAWGTICFAHWQDIVYGTAENVGTARTEGVAAATRAIEIDPSDHLAFTSRGLLQYRTGQRRAGLDDMRHAHRQNPNDTLTLNALGYTEAAFGNRQEGIEYSAMALRLSPRDHWRASMQQNLATAYFLARHYEKGVEMALDATREAPALAGAHTTLALNLVGLGRVDEAVTAVENARRIAPVYLEVRLSGGYQFERADDLERATTFLRIAAGLEDPGAADALR